MKTEFEHKFQIGDYVALKAMVDLVEPRRVLPLCVTAVMFEQVQTGVVTYYCRGVRETYTHWSFTCGEATRAGYYLFGENELVPYEKPEDKKE